MNIDSTLIKRLKCALAAREQATTIFTDADLTPASVLIPIFHKGGEYYLLLTKRTDTLVYHKGQICFPGGAQHISDKSPVDTALRETFEEIGVKPDNVQVLGQLDRMSTLTSNFLVTPFVGFIDYPHDFNINRDEIDELVEIPLNILADKQHYHEEEYNVGGEKKRGIVYEYNNKVIWGATARMIKQLADIVYADINEGGSLL